MALPEPLDHALPAGAEGLVLVVLGDERGLALAQKLEEECLGPTTPAAGHAAPNALKQQADFTYVSGTPTSRRPGFTTASGQGQRTRRRSR